MAKHRPYQSPAVTARITQPLSQSEDKEDVPEVVQEVKEEVKAEEPVLDTVPPVRATPEKEAAEALWRAKLQADMLLAEFDRVLRGPLAGKLRRAADQEKCPFGGDARQWAPLKTIQKLLDRLKVLEAPVAPEGHDTPSDAK